MNLAIDVKRTSLFCDAADYDFYKQCTGQGDAYSRPYATMFDAYIAFACIGFHYDEYLPIESSSQRQELTLASYLSGDKRLWTLAALAYSRLKSERPDEGEFALAQQVLSTSDIIPITEGWANAGVKIVKDIYDRGEIVHNRTLGLAEILLNDLEAV